MKKLLEIAKEYKLKGESKPKVIKNVGGTGNTTYKVMCSPGCEKN